MLQICIPRVRLDGAEAQRTIVRPSATRLIPRPERAHAGHRVRVAFPAGSELNRHDRRRRKTWQPNRLRFAATKMPGAQRRSGAVRA